MPTAIRKSAIESYAEAFARTHRKGKVKEKDVSVAIALIDTKLTKPEVQLELNDLERGVLQDGVMGILNDTLTYLNRTSILEARKHLETLSNTDYSIVKVTASYTPATASTGTLGVTRTSTQSSTFTYLWSQVSGPNSAVFTDTTVQAPGVSGLVTGTYVFKVVVTDSLGNVGEDTVDAVIA